MTTLNDLVDEVLLDLTSYGLYQPRLTSLTTSATDSDTTLNVASTTGFSSGLVEIDDELVFAQSADSTALTLSVVRGYRTTAAAHVDGATVTANPPWPRAMVKNAINDAIASSYPTLFKVATTDFTAKSVY